MCTLIWGGTNTAYMQCIQTLQMKEQVGGAESGVHHNRQLIKSHKVSPALRLHGGVPLKQCSDIQGTCDYLEPMHNNTHLRDAFRRCFAKQSI